jgi:hypothetical protein
VSAARDVSARLQELEQILTQSSDTEAAMRDEGPGGGRPCDVPLERVRRLVAAIRALPDGPPDAASSLAIRLLLDDCADAIGRLRAAIRDTADRLDGAARTLDACGKLLWREDKQVSKDARREPVPDAGPNRGGA